MNIVSQDTNDDPMRKSQCYSINFIHQYLQNIQCRKFNKITMSYIFRQIIAQCANQRLCLSHIWSNCLFHELSSWANLEINFVLFLGTGHDTQWPFPTSPPQHPQRSEPFSPVYHINKTQCQLCKRLARLPFPLSWSGKGFRLWMWSLGGS